jgi:lipopolysaccharide transport system permease protein
MSTQQDAIIAMAAEDFAAPQEKTVVFPRQSQTFLAQQDFLDGLKQWPIWLSLAYRDISVRYRRSSIGPFWLTLSMAITVYTMGYLYGHLFHTDLQRYYPLLAAGMLAWALLSSIITDATDAFTSSSPLIQQIKLPYTLYIHRVVTRNIIIFFHNIVVMVPILIIFHQYAKVNFCTLLIIPGLIAIYIASFIYSTIFAIIGARYRDVSQIIRSMIQVIFFVTPVMWEPDVLPAHDRFIIDLNPFYAYIQLIRAPLLGKVPTMHNLIVVLITTAIGAVIAAKMFTRYRARIVYWL